MIPPCRTEPGGGVPIPCSPSLWSLPHIADLVDAEGIQFAVTVTVDRGAHALHQRSQLALVAESRTFDDTP